MRKQSAKLIEQSLDLLRIARRWLALNDTVRAPLNVCVRCQTYHLGRGYAPILRSMTDLFEMLKTAMRSESHRTASIHAISTHLTPRLTNAALKAKMKNAASAATTDRTKKSSAGFRRRFFVFSQQSRGLSRHVNAKIKLIIKQCGLFWQMRFLRYLMRSFSQSSSSRATKAV